MNKKIRTALFVILIICIAFLFFNKFLFIKQTITGFPGKILSYNNQIVKPLKYYIITYGYGYRIDPYTKNYSFHNGVDLASIEGFAVKAVKDGNIVMKEENPLSYGKFVEIQHLDGTFTLYAHLSAFGNISLGQHVGAGSVIGAIGSTGRSTGPHLHFELRNKDQQPMDPSLLLGINRSIEDLTFR